MEKYNKDTIKSTLDSNLTIHWWNFRTKTLCYKGTVKDYIKEENISYRVVPYKNDTIESLKIHVKLSVGSLNAVRFTTNNLEDAVRMAINIRLTYLGDKSKYTLLGRTRTINF